MTPDERLHFLMQSTESLHASCQELHALIAEDRRRAAEERLKMADLDERERKGRRAILAAMRTYLESLDGAGEAE